MSPDAVKKELERDEEDAKPALRRRLKFSSTWQMVLLVVLILIALIGLCQVSGLAQKLGLVAVSMPTATPTALPTFTPIPTVTPTATLTPTATPTPQPQIAPGGQVVVQGTAGQKLRVRTAPGLTHEVVAALDDGTKLKVLEGPQMADGYTWWRVQTAEGVVGWVAADWLVPVAP
jgi:type V secretory pathway adhesin AidA